MDETERVRRLFDYVAEHEEYRVDLRPYLDTLEVEFKDKTVLEAGCGQGLTACHLAGAGGARSVVGFDMSPASIRQADSLKGGAGLSNARFEVATIEDFRATERFDVVCSFGVLQYVQDFFGCVDVLCGHLKVAAGATLVFTMSQPPLLSRLGSVARCVVSRLPERLVPAAVRLIAMILAPLNIQGRYGDRPLTNLVRESLFSPVYNLIPADRVAAHLRAAGFSASVRPFLGIEGMYTVIARRPA